MSTHVDVMFEVCCPPNSAATSRPTTASSSGLDPSRYSPSMSTCRKSPFFSSALRDSEVARRALMIGVKISLSFLPIHHF